MNVNAPMDCGNAPKKVFLKNFTIAMVCGNTDFLSIHTADHLKWEIVGRGIFTKENLPEIIPLQNQNISVTRIDIHQILTHGKHAAIHGALKMEDETQLSFCHLIECISAGKQIVRQVHSYLIPS